MLRLCYVSPDGTDRAIRVAQIVPSDGGAGNQGLRDAALVWYLIGGGAAQVANRLSASPPRKGVSHDKGKGNRGSSPSV